MSIELFRKSSEGAKRKLGLFHLHALLLQDSFHKEIPHHQQVFFRALAFPNNFKLLHDDLKLDKLVAKGHGNRYRLYSAFLYTMLRSEKGRVLLAGENPNLHSPDLMTWNANINSLLSDVEFSHSFVENTELSQQAIYPEAVPALRLIINRLNPDDKGLRIFDFGCGQNFDLPALKTEKTSISDQFRVPNGLNAYNRKVNLEEGVGMDSNQAMDVEWTKICTTQHYKDRKMVGPKIAAIDELAEIKAASQNVQFLKQSIFDFVPQQQGDVVLTKWMRYQIDDQDMVKQAVLRALKEGGYWISVGEEDKFKSRLVGKKYDFSVDEVWIWQKKDGKLVHAGSNPNIPKPIVTLSYGAVKNFDIDFFSNTK
jgi:hypothetical protein